MKKDRKNGRPLENNRTVRINETGDVFQNYIEAAKAINGNRTCVYACLKGLRKTHKGYTFSYEED